jgi:hypothetical protein
VCFGEHASHDEEVLVGHDRSGRHRGEPDRVGGAVAVAVVEQGFAVGFDGLLTIRIPKTRTAARIFMPSTEAEIPAGDRERVVRIYRGAEWRALARGKNGTWHAVADAPSEGAASEAALKSCAQTDSECRLYAIGNFRVAEE